MNQKLISLVVAIILACTLAVSPTSAKVVFEDVATTDDLYDEIQYLIDLGAIRGAIINGKSFYMPKQNVTRGQAAKMVVISAGGQPLTLSKSSYTDVTVGTEFSTYIERAKTLGYFSTTSTKFYPNEALTREEMSYVLTKAFKLDTSKYSSYAMPFNDISSSNTYAPYIKAVYYSGIAHFR